MENQYSPHNQYQQYQYPTEQNVYGQPADNSSPSLGDRFDWKQLATSMIILGVLGGVIVFAVAFLVDFAISAGGNQPGFGAEYCATGAAIGAIIATLVGLLYIPVLGSGNENLFPIAVVLLGAAAVAVITVRDGLFQGNLTPLVSVALILGSCVIAVFSTSRVEKAEF